MKVSGIQNNNLYHTDNLSFRGITNFDRILPSDKGTISKKSIKLINELNVCIDKEWKEIKNHNRLSSCPIFHIKSRGKSVTFEPIYSQKYPALLIDINEGKTSQKILLDRDNPNNFRYEKVIATDHGSATLRSYNSIDGKNAEIDNIVNNVIENDLEKVLSRRIWDRMLNRIEEGID